jgi:hypothetical protein
VCAILIEYLLKIAPRKSRRARTLLDPRSIFEGVWIQDVKKVVTDGNQSESNRFAVYTVRFAGDFIIEGRSYDETGKEFSRWQSEGPVNFSRDGRTMTYLWTGDVTGTTVTADRKGFAQLVLSSSGNGGTGRVDHVSMHVTLLFDLQRVTPALISGSPVTKPADLVDPDARDKFARYYAARLTQSSLRAS